MATPVAFLPMIHEELGINQNATAVVVADKGEDIMSLQNLGGVPPPDATGTKLGARAKEVAEETGTVGMCYHYVKISVREVIADFLTGGAAYMAADQLASHTQYFTEIKDLKYTDLPNLPAGVIVVWGKTDKSPYGHISVALGDGEEASDHLEKQHTNLRGYENFRVFMPK